MTLSRIFSADGPAALLLIRLVVGATFLSEGIQKFLFPATLGVGRFAKIGLPAPEQLATFVGVVEIGCGALVLLGLATRLSVVPLVIDMLVAIATTKIPLLHKSGFWSAAHEARVDFAMLLGSIFLLLVGAGRLSLDARAEALIADRARRADSLAPGQGRGRSGAGAAHSGQESVRSATTPQSTHSTRNP